MIRCFFKNFILISVLSTVASCAYFKSSEPAKIRIVGLDGKAHKIRTRTPELNSQIMRSQGRSINGPFGQQNFSSEPVFNSPTNRLASRSSIKSEKQKVVIKQSQPAKKVLDYGIEAPKPKEIVQKKVKSESSPKVTAGQIFKEQENKVEYDFSDKQIAEKSKPKKPKKQARKTIKKSSKKGIFVQTGAFSVKSHAEKSLSFMKKFSNKGQITRLKRGGKTLYKVYLGPFENRAQASKTSAKIKKSGRDAIIVRKK